MPGIADYVENEWPDYPVGIKPLLPPLATLYNGPESKKPKFSIVEMVLYNMAAMLAGFAAGYDVRLSNVSAIHPRLHPDRYVCFYCCTKISKLYYVKLSH
jgi:mitogen-activated protein kinase kinase kinase 9